MLAATISEREVGRTNGTARSAVARNAEPEKSMRIAIVGCGQIGRWHLDSYKKNPSCKVVAVADTDFAKGDVFALEAGAKAYISHSEMIASEPLDGVSVCTVPSTHRDIVLDVLDAGINVLCEKPLAISVRDAESAGQARRSTLSFPRRRVR